MDNRRVAGQTGILALTALLLLVLWGCPSPPAPESETPTPSEPPKSASVDDENQLLLDDFNFLERIAATGRVIIRISSDEDVASACDRKIKAQTYGPTVFWEPPSSPSQVTWQVAQQPNGSWMAGDRILLEQKRYSPDCFSSSTFQINYPSLMGSSGEVTNTECHKDFPVAWYYLGRLYNDECVTTGNPDGKVADWDPVVIIKPRK